MRKYTKADSPAKIIASGALKRAQAQLRRFGKTSAKDLTEEERQAFTESLREN